MLSAVMNPARDLTRLTARLDEVATVVRWPDERLYLRFEPISAWSPAQHVDHVLRALDMILDAVDTLRHEETGPVGGDGVPNLAGFAVLTTGWIPRRRGKAPEAAVPEPLPVRQRLREAVFETTARVRSLLPEAQRIAGAAGTLPHPVLGAFRAPQWVRFADIHTRHHMAIVADIDRRRAVGVRTPLLGEEGEWSAGAEAP